MTYPLCIVTGIKFLPPPPLPPNYVCRQQLLDEIVTKLCQSTINRDTYGTCLTITGAGGFGKTSLVTGLCHHPDITEEFLNGFMFIELGPQATDPSMKLCLSFNLLTGEDLKHCDVNYAIQKIKQFISPHCNHLLVIIDDVWNIEDAEPIVKAYSDCKIVLTTRMNDTQQSIPTSQTVTVGPMQENEALSLMLHGQMDASQFMQNTIDLLIEIAQDVHFWPLLLSLVRGQLMHNNRSCSSYCEAIKQVKHKLYAKGLIAFDKEVMTSKDAIKKNRKHAVKVCMGVTLDLLEADAKKKLKVLVLWNGIGTSLQKNILHYLWDNAEWEATDTINMLWTYGLVQFSDIKLPPHNKTQRCVEVHAVISHFLIQNMNSHEVENTAARTIFNRSETIGHNLVLLYEQSFGVSDLSSVKQMEYIIGEAQYCTLPFYIKRINMSTAVSPHHAIVALQSIQLFLKRSTDNMDILSFIDKQCEQLLKECIKVKNTVYKWSKKLNNYVQQCITNGKYQTLVIFLEDYLKDFPVSSIVENAISTIDKVTPLCSKNLSYQLSVLGESFHILRPKNHEATLLFIPYIKLLVHKIEKITCILQKNPAEREILYSEFLEFSNFRAERDLLYDKYIQNLKDVAPVTFKAYQPDVINALR